ncbi:MAG: FUSC family protein [Candidatus Brevundimonas colombiensis]|uniref:FUSC family protein n=1 Tax=Candidatus Brevundimonas colombiensis TaxID=3121376 RepID=A0AAJ6BJ25_9CAUL|nr:FUSC family protein [Brevundimonas sp.]WEK39410.1 MAG: FUSC family protein [Brevundimonas sp.]
MARALSPRRAAEVRAALQMAVAATAALYLATLLGLPHPYWSVISAIVVVQASVTGGVVAIARDRAIGTMTGALVGAGVAFIRSPGMESLALSIAISTAVLAFLGAGRPWLKIAPVTATIVIAGGAGSEGPASLALDRVMEILVGSGVGVIAILALFPRHAHQAFTLNAREAAGEAAVLLALVAKGDAGDAAEISRRHADLKRRLDALAQTAKNVVDFPGLQRETADRAALARAFWRVRSDIVILGRGFHDEGADGRLAPWSEDAARAVERLEALSRGKAADPMGPIDQSLALSIAVEGDDMALGAAAIGVAHMHRDLDDLAARFRDLRLV